MNYCINYLELDIRPETKDYINCSFNWISKNFKKIENSAYKIYFESINFRFLTYMIFYKSLMYKTKTPQLIEKYIQEDKVLIKDFSIKRTVICKLLLLYEKTILLYNNIFI